MPIVSECAEYNFLCIFFFFSWKKLFKAQSKKYLKFFLLRCWEKNATGTQIIKTLKNKLGTKKIGPQSQDKYWTLRKSNPKSGPRKRGALKRRQLKPGTRQLYYWKINVTLNWFIFTKLSTLVQNMFLILVYIFCNIAFKRIQIKTWKWRIVELV